MPVKCYNNGTTCGCKWGEKGYFYTYTCGDKEALKRARALFQAAGGMVEV